MKYLMLVLLVVGCSSTPKPNTLESCIEYVKSEVHFDKYAENDNKYFAEMGIVNLCKQANNDPKKAMDILRYLMEK